MELYIYTEYKFSKFKNSGVYKGILGEFYYNIKSNGNSAQERKGIADVYNASKTSEEIIQMIKEELSKSDRGRNTLETTEYVKAEFVTVKKGKWISGEYYAHEYGEDEGYTDGRARKLTYSNGFVEYEIQCLNKEFIVGDGIWEEYNNNGSGDTFEPFERGLE